MRLKNHFSWVFLLMSLSNLIDIFTNLEMISHLKKIILQCTLKDNLLLYCLLRWTNIAFRFMFQKLFELKKAGNQAGAELGQAWVKLEVIVKIMVEVWI